MYAQGVCGLLEKDTVNREQISSREFEMFYPREVCISLKQGNAAAARPVVHVGQRVALGQLIGEGSFGLSVPVYASIAGIVTEIQEIPASVYEKVSHIVIKDDGENVAAPVYLKPERSRAQWMKNIGIIELLHTRQSFYRRCFSGCRVTELKVAAFDREPFVYSDYRLLLECPSKVLFGAKVLAGIWGLGCLSIYVCDDEIRYVLEKAVNSYRKVLAPLADIRFYKVDEDMYARSCSILNKSDGGFWCSAVELGAVYDGFYDDKPMTGRGVTVSGAVRQPKNLWVPNGTPVRDLLEYCGGILGEKCFVDPQSLSERHINIIEGGPLRGHCVNVENAVTSLTTESVIVLPRARIREMPCIQCQECANICPVDLLPMHIEKAVDCKMAEGLLMDVDQCVECGWCSYVCPSGRRLKEKASVAKKMPSGLRFSTDGAVRADVSACHITEEYDSPDTGNAGKYMQAAGRNADGHVKTDAGNAGGNMKTDAGNVGRYMEPDAGIVGRYMESDAGNAGRYIELDADMAAAMEPLVMESQGGPYIHGRQTTVGIQIKLVALLSVMLLCYMFEFGPWMAVKGILSVGACLLFETAANLLNERSWGRISAPMGCSHTFSARLRQWLHIDFRWLPTISTGLVIAMAFYGDIPLRWMLAADFLAFFIGKMTKQSPAVFGITGILAIYGIFRNPAPAQSLVLAVLWMGAYIYLIYEEIIVPWKTLLFMVAFGLFGTILGGGALWSPTIFLAGVLLINDYKNAGRDTPLGRILAAFCGALCGIFAALMPVEIGVCLGLLIANIIACNLMAYTI